ncbi:putative transposase [Streptomyces himastatinicus ATCC 53653]|uniref:Putative transposase n=1 Tax=Streptomyces himastatinicus ATCC 53653 TaxID=457427 RepID=D9WIR9_9ACTN|nr:putative transposase [Streptomyces himastatinicus ATCC 53653]
MMSSPSQPCHSTDPVSGAQAPLHPRPGIGPAQVIDISLNNRRTLALSHDDSLLITKARTAVSVQTDTERSLAWIMHARRHARDYERLVQHSESLITWAAITLMTRRLTRRRQVKPLAPPLPAQAT